MKTHYSKVQIRQIMICNIVLIISSFCLGMSADSFFNKKSKNSIEAQCAERIHSILKKQGLETPLEQTRPEN